MLIPGLPRASWANLLASSPLIVAGLRSSATAVQPAATAAAAEATSGAGIQATAVLGPNSGNYYAVGVTGVTSDGISPSASSLEVCGRNFAFNNAMWDRFRNSAAANISQTTQPYPLGVANPGEWTAVHQTAAATRATATKAAGGAGVRHVCRSITCSIANEVAAVSGGAFAVALRDGASGAGTILWTAIMSIPTGADCRSIAIAGLNIFGSANTAMTLEFAIAGPANSYEYVSLSGYSTI